MCLIVFAWKSHADLPLVVAANRDELHARATEPAAFWEDLPQVCAGRDLVAGGTWLGITRGGRFAAVTNYREGVASPDAAHSRGRLTREFLAGDESPQCFLQRLQPSAGDYAGFNLLLGEIGGELCYFSNRATSYAKLSPGIYGLSNGLLDTPWPKVTGAKAALGDILRAGHRPGPEQLLEILADRSLPPDDALPATGVGMDLERLLSPRFITAPGYGTRSSTGITVDASGSVALCERSFDAGGAISSEVCHRFSARR